MQLIRQKLKVSKYLFFILLVPSLLDGALNKTYPTAATTNLRIETYVDGISTMHNSTWTVNVSTWGYFGSTMTWINNDYVTGYVYTVENSCWTVKHASWTVSNLLDSYMEVVKYKLVDKILNQDIEQYLVWPSTVAPAGWKGWCLDKINGKDVPIVCR